MDTYSFIRPRLAPAARFPHVGAHPFANLFIHRVLYKLACAVLLPLCALAGGASLVHTDAPAEGGGAERAARAPRDIEWPATWNGRRLRPLALGAVEARFAEHFPGRIARFTDGQAVLVMRTVDAPTRMLHPAADCYRGLGWRVEHERLQARAGGALWRCFDALGPNGERLQVCERIEDSEGRGFTDTSAWYWAAAWGRSRGPWRTVTEASAAVGSARHSDTHDTAGATP